jgi:hypothetical protein
MAKRNMPLRRFTAIPRLRHIVGRQCKQSEAIPCPARRWIGGQRAQRNMGFCQVDPVSTDAAAIGGSL